MIGDISERCLRCFKEQYWFGENFLFNYINEDSIKGKRVLEIGCAEAGLLKFYNDNGAMCSGLELSDTRFNNAMLLNDKDKLKHKEDIQNNRNHLNSLKGKNSSEWREYATKCMIEIMENKN